MSQRRYRLKRLLLVKTRFSRCAQVIARDGMYAGIAGAKTGHGRMTLNWRFLILDICCFGLVAFSPLRRCHQRTVLAVRGDKIAGSDFEQPKAAPTG
jgi:hypothetical protein